MAVRNRDMDSVPGYGDILQEGCYHFRITRVDDDGGDIVLIHSTVQTEPFVGRQVRDRVDLTNEVGIQKLKSYYQEVGYQPPKGTHDPTQIEGGEFTAVVVHNIDKGTTYANIAPWSIRGLGKDPVQPLGPKGH